MRELGEFLLQAAAIGCGATAVMDLWALAQNRMFGTRPLDYGLVGRWIAHMLQGRFLHRSIEKSEEIPSERLIGWAAHYGVGVAFAAILLAIWGEEWFHRPALLPALIVGIASVAAPFFLMQPAMGWGVAASQSPRPAISRLRSVVTHAIFGFGLYLSGLLLGLFRT